MFPRHQLVSVVLILCIIQFTSSAVLMNLFNRAIACETECEHDFSSLPELKKPCGEGCRLYTVIGFAKDVRVHNETLKLCESACSEAFHNKTSANACNVGCRTYPLTAQSEEDVQTLHLLTPLMYVRSAYDSMAHHVRQFISTSWTVYVQEDSGKMVVLQTSPKVVESSDYGVDGNIRDYQQNFQEAKVDWMDCISHQSGIPRWLLAAVLFGFSFALLWLCCATLVTAPNQYVSSSRKKDVGYILVCEQNKELKKPLVPMDDLNEEAPPLPPKVSLI